MEQTPPTADELGISDVEYERIMRGLRHRGQSEGTDEQPATRIATRRRPKWFAPVVVLLLVVFGFMFRSHPAEGKPAYAFLHSVNGIPTAQSSCRPVPVAIYPAGGPPDAEQLVREAVAKLRSATGLDIVVTGVFGGHAPNWNFERAPLLPDDPISVSWQDGRAIADLTDEVAGMGGSRVVTSPMGTPYLISGTIALSREFFAGLAAKGDHDKALGVLLHEFGHVLGLDHVESRRELMYPSATGRGSFGPGDLQGLRLLGQGPCI